jgi:hypothetical protein
VIDVLLIVWRLVASHKIIIVLLGLLDILRFLDLLGWLCLELFLLVLGSHQDCASEDVVFRLFFLYLLLLFLALPFTPYLHLLILFLGFGFVVLPLLLDDPQFFLDLVHVLPGELIVDEEEGLFEEVDQCIIIDAVEVFFLALVAESFSDLLSKLGEIFVGFEDLYATLDLLVATCRSDA